jgi:transcriptional regulator with XRE-family HTH domain
MKKRSRSDIRERFGFAIKARREELGVTQEELADRSGINRTYLSDVERGYRNICLLNIERVASALSVPLSELFKEVERG